MAGEFATCSSLGPLSSFGCDGRDILPVTSSASPYTYSLWYYYYRYILYRSYSARHNNQLIYWTVYYTAWNLLSIPIYRPLRISNPQSNILYVINLPYDTINYDLYFYSFIP